MSVKKDSTIVGHVPKKLSCLCSLFLLRGGNICCEVTGLWCYSFDLPQGGLEIPCNLVFEGSLKEVEKVKKLVHWLTLIHPPVLKKLMVGKILLNVYSNVNLEITKSPLAAISVSEPSSTVVKINKSAGASDIVSKLTMPAEKSDNSENCNKLSCSIKVEDSPYALVDLTGSSASLESEIKNVVNQEELLRIRLVTKLTELSINAVQKMLKQQFLKLKGLVSTLLQEKKNSGMCKPIKNQLQILHSCNDHWIAASTVDVHCNDSEVCVLVYDFAYLTVDEKTSAIISNLLLSDNIIIQQSQKQSNGEDCGLFAIANATAISNGVDPCKIKLIEHTSLTLSSQLRRTWCIHLFYYWSFLSPCIPLL